MDSQNLKTASHYVNNLLLSRGLLRNGIPIEFAKPSKGDGGKESTMAQIINLVHDMVLRRDRETETLSTISQNLQSLRTTSTQQVQHISRIEAKNGELERQLAFSVSQERTAKSNLHTAETRNRVLRDEMGRLKTTVSQIRSQCANDVRKRDGEIKRLKKYLEGRRGREGNGGPVGVMVITPGMPKSKNLSSGGDVESANYSLKEETTDFLTQLSQNLSNENDALINLVQTTLSTLRNLQGLPDAPQDNSGWATDREDMLQDDPNVNLSLAPPYEQLVLNMEDVLENLRGLLTNPSFVPLEEVEIREDEIIRLREGWDKMEARWREAVGMMDGWRKRMMETGDTINLDDLRKGLDLGSEDIIPPSLTKNDSVSADESLLPEPDFFVDGHSDEFEDLPSLDRKNDVSPVKADIGRGLFPAPKILQSASGNVRRRSPSPRKAFVPAPVLGVLAELDVEDAADELALLDFESPNPVPPPSPSKSEVKQPIEALEPVLTVQQKLEKAQQEAEEACARDEKKPVKRTAIPRKIKSRRRSTLSPEELEALMGMR